MRFGSLLFLLAGLVATPAYAGCDGVPWKFGMSPKEVAEVTECGPYKSFSNGDLETYNGVFDGKNENFQFFFQDGKLRRIGIYLYEGHDPSAGAKVWLRLYPTMTRLFGNIETPRNIAPASEGAMGAFTAKALEEVQGPGKIQMAPVAQPKDAFVFASFMRNDVGDEKLYNVVLYYDRRP
jgi:hypothetical protein